MNKINAKQLYLLLDGAADAVIENEQLLCELDAHVGDGDHGITVSRGFKAVKKALAANDDLSISQILVLTGDTLAETMGGAIGPIFGSIFTAMGEKAEAAEEIDSPLLKSMLLEGLDNVMTIGGAKPGDRTLVDALAPAVEAINEELSFSQSIDLAAQAALKGAKGTINMVAKKGRARFLQEKSKGYQDAGATSLYILLNAMAEAAKNL